MSKLMLEILKFSVKHDFSKKYKPYNSRYFILELNTNFNSNRNK